ncbi:MAG: non-ribosomal peptide synthetase, partial [Longimicrobiales bacterium]
MSTTRDSLSDAKRALLEQRMRGRPAADPAAAIPRRPASEATVLSPGQHRLWFLHQLAPESAAYTMFDARRLIGPIDDHVLHGSLAGVVRRHEILRTRYETRDGRPVAIVAPAAAFDFEMIAFDSVPEAEREHRVREHADAAIRRPFDLATGPVLRASLLRLGARDRVLVLAVHHIACDEWSLDIVWREIATRYTSNGGVRPAALDEQVLQYADFAHWQLQRLASDDTGRHAEYWRSTLGARPPMIELPPDRVPPARRSFRGGLVSAPIDPEVARSLAELARRAGTTSFVLHLAAFEVLLHRYTGETDLVVGVPATGRNRQALEPVVGFFLNTLPLRADVSGDPRFRDLLRRVHETFLEGVTHQDTPFEAMVDTIAPQRRLSQNPLFSVMFVEQTGPPAVGFGDAVVVSRYRVNAGASKFDLTLFAGDRGDGPETMIEYDADRFDRPTATRMVEHFHALLAAIAADPDRPISMLPLASAAERHRIDGWSRGPAAVGLTDPVHRQFRTRARATPGRAAIVTDDESLSYDQLDARANGIARRLRASGVAPNDRVALCVDRSPDMIAGILGILEAGAAYVPLDPAYPPSRHEFAIRDTGARIVFTTRARAPQLPATSAAVLLLDGDEPVPADVSLEALAATEVSLDDAAYVLHTSGSTGAPKGVVITHRNLACSTAARSVTYPEPPGVFMLLPSFAFDSSVAGIFWTLTTGGTLALPPQRIEQDVHALASFIARHSVTHTLCLPSLWDA